MFSIKESVKRERLSQLRGHWVKIWGKAEV